MNETDVQQIARAFVAKVDISGISYHLDPYIQEVGAKLKREELDDGDSGYTLTKGDKHIIVVNSLESEERQRFTICHEIAHIVLGLPTSHEEVPSWSFAKRHPNEVACDTFAAELLMPYKQWLSSLPSGEPSLDQIKFMAEKFGTSFPAAASRLASLNPRPCAYVTMENGTIKYSVRSTALRRAGAWISPNTKIPDGSVSYRLRSANNNAVAQEHIDQDIWFENWESGSELIELARHYQTSDTTIALLWLEDDDLPEIETDRFGNKIQDDGGFQELTGELPWPGKRKRR